ncbi:MAG: ribonuclease III [Acidobacteriota bacterium]|nr:ribonuclease III [Acidobacteriota bacterium]
MTSPSIDQLQKAIGYRFSNPELLIEALTHTSYSQETVGESSASARARDNEQFEFLGDAVLGFVVSVKLADAYPDAAEGNLSRARSSLVATEHLCEVAAKLGIGNYLRLGHGEEKTGGRSKSRLLVNALEALVAAIYRDGGIAAAERFITRFIVPKDLKAVKGHLFAVDYKSALQEYLQAGHMGAASYRIVAEDGPEHRKVFAVEVTASGWVAQGRGGSKKVAEQEAARMCLEMVERSRLADG